MDNDNPWISEIKAEIDRVLKEYFGSKLDKYLLIHSMGNFHDLFVKVTDENLDLPMEYRYMLEDFCDERECVLKIFVGSEIEGRNM